MKTIFLNGQKINVSAAEERVLRALSESGYAERLSAFEEGRGQYKKNHARIVASEKAESPVGIRIYRRDAPDLPARVRRWFERNPRNYFCVSGNVRRINAVLRKLSGE